MYFPYSSKFNNNQLPMRRAAILGRSLSESIEKTIEYQERRRSKLEEYLSKRRDQAGYRMELIELAVEQAAFDHLGYGPTANIERILNTALDQAIEFFCGDWWKDGEDDHYFVDKTDEYPVQGWHYPYRHAVLLAHWTNRWDDVRRVLDWVDDDVGRGLSHGDPFLNLYIYINSILHRRLSNHGKLADAIKKDGTRFENLVVESCVAISQSDEKAFSKALTKTIKQFLKSEAKDVSNFMYWISVETSLLWAFAERNGIALPELDASGDAVIIRPESIFSGQPPSSGAIATLDQDELDGGLMTAVAELDFDAFASLLERGANPDREEAWDAELLDLEHTDAVLASMTPRKLVFAIRDEIANLSREEAAKRLAAEILGRARRIQTEDEIETLINGFCDHIGTHRPADSG